MSLVRLTILRSLNLRGWGCLSTQFMVWAHLEGLKYGLGSWAVGKPPIVRAQMIVSIFGRKWLNERTTPMAQGLCTWVSQSICCRNFNEANVVKHEAVIRALEMGYRVVSTDSDIVWLRNPLSYLRRAAGNDYDIVFQCDNALSDPKCNLCAGFYYANATTHAINAFKWLVSTKLEVSSQWLLCVSSGDFSSVHEVQLVLKIWQVQSIPDHTVSCGTDSMILSAESIAAWSTPPEKVSVPQAIVQWHVLGCQQWS